MAEDEGKKVSPLSLRPGDRGAAVLRPDQAIERQVARAPNSIPGEDVAGIKRPAQEARFIGRRKRNAGVPKSDLICSGTGTAFASRTTLCRLKTSPPSGLNAAAPIRLRQ